MSMMKVVKKMFFALAIGSILLLAFSCKSRPNEEQRQKMEDTRAAALSAEQKLEEVRQSHNKMESDLNKKKAELDKVKSEKADVDKRLENWNE